MTDSGRRKVLIRLIGAPLLLAALGLVLYGDYRRESTMGLRWLLLVVAILSAREFYGLCSARGLAAARTAALVCLGAGFFPWNLEDLGKDSPLRPWLRGNPVVWAGVGLLGYVLLKLVFRHGTFTVEAASMTMTGYLYIGLLSFLREPPVREAHVPWYLLFILAANKGSDMAAYAVGKLVGRSRMTPRLSPHKTWEGAVGGTAVGTALSLGVLVFTPLDSLGGRATWALLFFTLVVTMAAQVGDLVESAFKRWAGVKDSGRLLPEFGGMLDMVDGFLVSVPVAHVLCLLLVKIL